jgi:transposase
MQYLIPCQRIDIIYDYHVHGGNVINVAQRFGLNYTTVINALNGYEDNGRIFKLLPIHSKQFILKHRL